MAQQGSEAVPSTQPPLGKAPRDAKTSLRYQALNADSYHLDSPPFTGAAVAGAGSAGSTDQGPEGQA